MNRTKISICIPTYNRADMLAQLLESIISQGHSECVEVAISDNASTDNTSEIVHEYKRKGVNIKYSREEINRGADFNYLNAVKISTGEYCWFFGSDDLIPEGALKHVLRIIEETRACIFLGARQNFDNRGALCDIEQWVKSEDRYFDISSSEGYSNYMQSATGIGALFSYLSSIVFCRSNWNAETVHESYMGTAYSHVHALMQIALKNGVYYTSRIIANNRTNNDSFLVDGEIRRVMIDLEGYVKLSNDLFPELHNNRRYEFLNVLRKSRPTFKTLVSLRVRQSNIDWNNSRKIFQGCGYSSLLIYFVGLANPIIRVIYLVRGYLKGKKIK
jgi:abequosyltransferase